MTPELYTEIVLNRDEPQEGLLRGDVATFIDTVPHPEGGEEGAVLEIFNIMGESVRVAIVPMSSISLLRPDLMPTTRQIELHEQS